MNFYMNHGSDWIEPIARGLYAEIALIEEQQVTHYESLLDPLDAWLKQLVFHEYNEVYLYWCELLNKAYVREILASNRPAGRRARLRVGHGSSRRSSLAPLPRRGQRRRRAERGG